MSYTKIKNDKVMKLCRRYREERVQRVESILDKKRQKLRKWKKYFFFGPQMWSEAEINDIIDKGHWFMSPFSGLFHTYREQAEFYGFYDEGIIRELELTATASDCDMMDISSNELRVLSKYL